MTAIRMTNHARARRSEFRLTEADVRDILEHPLTSYPASDRYGEDVRIAQSGTWGVVYRDITDDMGTYRLVITILRQSADEWVHNADDEVSVLHERIALLEGALRDVLALPLGRSGVDGRVRRIAESAMVPHERAPSEGANA